MDEPHIEQATLEDLPQLTDLLYDLFTQEGDFVPNRAKQMRGLRLILEQPSRGRIFVLRQNGTILGMINLLFTISTAEGGFVIMLEDVIVHCAHRGKGFGDKLLQRRKRTSSASPSSPTDSTIMVSISSKSTVSLSPR